MEPVVKNLVYQSKKPFLSEEEVQQFENIFEEKSQVILKIDRNIVNKWAKKISELPFPKWTDSLGRVWSFSSVSPVLHARKYRPNGPCGKHQDAKYIILRGEEMRAVAYEGGVPLRDPPLELKEVDQFKLLIYLTDIPKGGTTRIFIDKDGKSKRDTKEHIKIQPRKGHYVFYHLDLWHDGEPTEHPKSLVGFRIRYKLE